MTDVGVRGSSALAENATSGPITPAIPAGTVEGDVCHLHVLAYRSGTTAPTIATPSGWTELRTGTNTTEGTISLRMTVFRLVVPAGGASAPSVSASGGTQQGVYAAITTYSGADITTPEDATVPAAQTGDSTTVTAPSVTTVTPGAMVGYYLGQLDNQLTGSPNNSTTELYSYLTTIGSDASLIAASKAMASAGAAGATSVTGTGSLQFIGITVPIAPAAADGGGWWAAL